MSHENDFHLIRISQGKHRGRVKNVEMAWRKFCRAFVEPSVDQTTTYGSYLHLSVDEQGAKKAAPGYIVGAQFEDGKRRLANMKKRSLISFDMDEVTADQMDEIEMGLSAVCEYEFLRHTSRKHCPEKPRWRIHMPISRSVDHDEANAITRIMASRLFSDPQESMDAVDVVSHRFAQVSYMPSRSKDQEYRCERNEGMILDVDEFLASFDGDWHDHTQLPMRSDEGHARAADPSRKMEDPREKPGIIGAWCRTFTVDEVIQEFLSDVYEPGVSTDGHERYSYIPGQGANGAVSYDDGMFLHSNHGTDPIEGSANAFDLARVHLYGHLDKNAREGTTPGNMPSFKATADFAGSQGAVKAELLALNIDRFDDDFDDDDEDDDEPPAPAKKTPDSEHVADDSASKKPLSPPKTAQSSTAADDPEIADLLGETDDDDDEVNDDVRLADRFDDDEDDDGGDADDDTSEKPKKKPKGDRKWLENLTVDGDGKAEKTRYNAATVIINDPRISGRIAKNDFTGTPYATKRLGFKKMGVRQDDVPKIGRRWTDVDMSALAVALSAPRNMGGYEVDFTEEQMRKGILQAAQRFVFNPVLDLVHEHSWDGQERIETFFIDYLGCEGDAYHREAALAWFTAAIARLHEPGHKFDFVPILEGKQEIGKSGLIGELAIGFFGELSKDFNNHQRMVESIRGKWILEVAELSGFRLAEVEDIKAFFSRPHDTVRLAYRENEEDFPRRCVFMGTSNKGEYLRDPTGNRRFWPIKATVEMVDFPSLIAAVPQLWAEAEMRFFALRKAQPHGFLPFNLISDAARAKAKELQDGAREVGQADLLRDVIREWVDTPVPEAVARGNDDQGFDADEGEAMYVRNVVSVKMITEQLCDHPSVRANIRNDRLIGEALNGLEGWSQMGNVRRAVVLGGRAGQGRFYQRMQGTNAPWIEEI